MTAFDLSTPSTPKSASESPPSYGRAEFVRAVLEVFDAHHDVIVEGDAGLGKTRLRASVAHAVALTGRRVISAEQLASDSLDGPIAVIDDLAAFSPHQLTQLSAAHANGDVRFLLTRTPPYPLVAGPDVSRISALAAAVPLTLQPLTLDQCNALIDEQLTLAPFKVRPSTVERTWIWAASGGFAGLAVSIMHDVSEARDEEGSLMTPSRHTLIEASTIIGGLPPTLQRFAADLLPLVGVTFSRIRRFFDRVKLSLLAESHVISEDGEALCIALPLQASLRMITQTTMSSAARDAIADICAAVALYSECTESEVSVAANALMTDSELRRSVDERTQLAVLTMGMWLARRRGEMQAAASLARRILTTSSAGATDAHSRIARQNPDDFAGLAATLRSGDADPAPNLAVWGMSLMLPLTAGISGADELLEALTERVPGEDRASVAGARTSMLAAAALEHGNFDEALAITARVLAAETTDTLAALRAHCVDATVHAARLDHAALRATAEALLRTIAEHIYEHGLRADAVHRTVIDAVTVLSCSFAAAGDRIPKTIEELVVRILMTGFEACDPQAATAATISHMLIAAQNDQPDEVEGDRRFLMRKPRTATSAWVLALLAGQPSVEYSGVSPVLAKTVTAVQALTLSMQAGMAPFVAALGGLSCQSDGTARAR